MTQYVEKVLDFTPTRIFWWLLSLAVSLIPQFVLMIIIESTLFPHSVDDEGSFRRSVVIGAILFSATISQLPVFIVAKIFVLRGILFWCDKRNRIKITLLVSVCMSILSSIFFLFILNGNWLGSDYSSLIASLIAIPFAVVDILTYVFFMEKIFTQRAEV